MVVVARGGARLHLSRGGTNNEAKENNKGTIPYFRKKLYESARRNSGVANKNFICALDADARSKLYESKGNEGKMEKD